MYSILAGYSMILEFASKMYIHIIESYITLSDLEIRSKQCT
jgi:hypothetical protein